MSTKERKRTFKRAEVHAIGKLIEAATTEVSHGLVNYKDGHSDETVAEAARTKHLEVTAEDVRRIRPQLGYKLATEGRPAKETLAAVLRSQAELAKIVASQSKAIADLQSRLDALEDEATEPVQGEAVVIPKSHYTNGRR